MAEEKKKAENGSTVKIHYTGTLADGTVFDSSKGKEPLEFKLGEKKVIPGFEAGVNGMSVGEKKKLEVKSADAYGDSNPGLVQEVPMEALKKAGIKPEAGMVLGMQHPAQPGVQLPAKVVEVGEKTVKLDLNHPLAGKDLTFDVELVSVE